MGAANEEARPAFVVSGSGAILH